MSVLGDYYRSMIAENELKLPGLAASAALTNAQADATAQNAASTALDAQTRARAGASQNTLTNAQAGQVAPNAAATRDLDASRAQQNRVTTGLQPGLVGSEIGKNTAAIDFTRSQTAAQLYQLPHFDAGYGPGSITTTQSSVLGQLPQAGLVPPVQGFSKGGTVKGAKAAKAETVQGKGKPGPTDTVPTMLTPGEAVLNKGAAEHYGREVIDKMNAMGLLRMGAQSEAAKAAGQPDPHAPPEGAKGKQAKAEKTPADKRKGYAGGTSRVPGATTPAAATDYTNTPANLPPFSLVMLPQDGYTNMVPMVPTATPRAGNGLVTPR